MGREWLYKATGGGDAGKSPSSVAGKPMNGKKEKYKNTSGCMSAIYNQFRFHHPSFMSSESAIPDNNIRLQGIEAPRNSLESPESAMNVAPSSSRINQLTNLNIPLSRIEIKTHRSNFSDDLSPGTKTPNVVARLMGLDILPEYSSPRQSSSSTTANSHYSTRSLPATPRVSTASRRSTDNDNYHHRLSLQIDKENNNYTKPQRRRSEIPINRQDAKHYTNQIRERIGRRLGTDITNTVSPPARIKYQRRDSNLVKAPVNEIITGKAKVRVLDIKGNLNINKPSSIEEVKLTSEILGFQKAPLMKQKKVVKDEKIKRMASERYDLRLKKMNQQENKKSTTKRLTSFKKEITSSSSTKTRLHQKLLSLPSNLNSSSYNSNDTHNIRWLSTAFVGEVEDMVVEIESAILENMVREIAMDTVAPAGSDRVRSHVRAVHVIRC